MRKKILGLILAIVALYAFVGCGAKKEAAKVKEEPKIEAMPSAEPSPSIDPHEGMVKSKVNGQWIDKKLAKYRPLAIMMGNTSQAAPQSGISKASVVYEIPVEGGITRLMSIIEDYKHLKKIGTARSCRYYFVHYAMEYNALYSHFGQSKYAKKTLADNGVDNINGLEYVSGKAYYRTKDRKAPHNAYADGKKIYQFCKDVGYPLKYKKNYDGHFIFSSEENPEKLENGEDAYYIRPGYRIDDPWYEYHEEEGLYYRYQYKKPHIDKETKKQLTCKNIIIQYVRISYFDDNYSLIIDTTRGGEGVYITEGKAIPISWKKKSDYAITHYYDENGNEIKVNPGVTWVLLVDKNKKKNVIISREKQS